MSAIRRTRSGMTLVELLVVTGLMASLLGLVVVGLRGGGGANPRRAGEILASALLAAQSRALGDPEGAGLIIEPSGSVNSLSTTVIDAMMQPQITGAVTAGLPTGTGLSQTAADITIQPDNADGTDGMAAYRVLLFGSGSGTKVQPPTAWFEFRPASSTSATTVGSARFRTATGQTATNTIWPKPAGSQMNARLTRYPAKSSSVVSLDKSLAIDLRYSGVGDVRTTPYGRLDNRGAIGVTFNRIGGLDEVMRGVPLVAADLTAAAAAVRVQPLSPTQPLYFLVAKRSDIDAGLNTLANTDSVWVVVFPQGGRVTVSANVSQSADDDASLAAARAKARAGVPIGR